MQAHIAPQIIETAGAFYDAALSRRVKLEDSLPWGRTNEEIEVLRGKIEKVDRLQKLFSDVIHNLPDCLKLVTVPNESVELAALKAERQAFEQEAGAKREFYAATLGKKENRDRFVAMGLPPEKVKYMQKTGWVPPYRSQTQEGARPPVYDITVDHKKELSLGGGNDLDNLCFIPDYLNLLKEKLLFIQRSFNESAQSLVMLLPVDDSPVPFIFGGYRERDRTQEELKRRVHMLFRNRVTVDKFALAA